MLNISFALFWWQIPIGIIILGIILGILSFKFSDKSGNFGEAFAIMVTLGIIAVSIIIAIAMALGKLFL